MLESDSINAGIDPHPGLAQQVPHAGATGIGAIFPSSMTHAASSPVRNV
jgi:hypothetical protein